jgi:hypothetical protein
MKKFIFITVLVVCGLTAYTPSDAIDVKLKSKGKRVKSGPAGERKKMIRALKSRNRGSRYFRSVRWKNFTAGNRGAKISTIGEVCSGDYRCIPPLLGAFRNRDAKVRNAVYNELAFLGYNRSMEENRKTRRYYRQLTSAIKKNLRREKERNAGRSLRRLDKAVARGGKVPPGREAGKDEQKRFQQALRSGSRGSRYFQSVVWKKFARGNMGMKMSTIAENCIGNYRCISPLLGAFNNRDGRVRNAVYRELAQLGYNSSMEKNRKAREHYRQLTSAIKKNMRKERDRRTRRSLERLNAVVGAGSGTAMKKDAGHMERKKFVRALRDKRDGSRYFVIVSWENFNRGNMGGKMSTVHEICRRNYDCIPPLLGGFKNRDLKVRKAVYRELAYLGYSKEGLKRHHDGRRYERMIKQNIANNERRERDSTAKRYLMDFKGVFSMTVPEAIKARDTKGLATMSPRIFGKSNGYGKTTYISSMLQQKGASGQNLWYFLLDAAVYGKGDPTTQQYIVGEMGQAVYLFSGPVKGNMARSIKRKVRRVRNAGIKKQLTRLAERLEKKSGGM